MKRLAFVFVLVTAGCAHAQPEQSPALEPVTVAPTNYDECVDLIYEDETLTSQEVQQHIWSCQSQFGFS